MLPVGLAQCTLATSPETDIRLCFSIHAPQLITMREKAVVFRSELSDRFHTFSHLMVF